MRRAFTIGHEVGDLACQFYPDGIMIDASAGIAAAAEATASTMAMPHRRPLFEATFIHQNVAVRVDLLLPVDGGWHLVEVKSTTRVKPYQRADLATQLWVLRGCGVAVSRASIRVIDPGFVLRADGDYTGLLIDMPADAEVERLAAARERIAAGAHAALAGNEPDMAVGPQCSDPFPCAFDAYCRRDIPPAPTWPVSLLPGTAGKAIARASEAQGIDDLLAVDPDAIVAPLLKRIHAATLSGIAWHDVAAIRTETAGWAYPHTFLDFESIGFAVPRWLGTSPHQQISFQFSAHIDRGTGEVEHIEFLSLDGNDPRATCAQALAALPGAGAVIAWNAPFERSCLQQLAAVVPEYVTTLRSLADRLVDLLPIARRHYYHRDMRGRWSIKAVLPTLAPELDYTTLDGTRSGLDAQDAYLEAIEPTTSPERRAKLRQELLDYCQLDTIAMVVALERLSGLEGRARSNVAHC